MDSNDHNTEIRTVFLCLLHNRDLRLRLINFWFSSVNEDLELHFCTTECILEQSILISQIAINVESLNIPMYLWLS